MLFLFLKKKTGLQDGSLPTHPSRRDTEPIRDLGTPPSTPSNLACNQADRLGNQTDAGRNERAADRLWDAQTGRAAGPALA